MGRSWGAAAWLSLAAHGILLVLIVLHGRALLERAGAGDGKPRGGESVQFFTLPAAGVSAVDVPPAPTITLAPIPPIDPVAVDLSRITVPLPSPTTASSRTAGGAAGQTGTAAGTGGAGGSGTGDEDRYILPPNPRGVIVPPERAPRSVRGRKYRATFWVGADGRVDRVELSPPIEDAEYRAALIERLMDFAFYPARRAGIAIPGVVPIVFAIP